MELVRTAIEHADDVCLAWRVSRGVVLLTKLAIQLKRRRAAARTGRTGRRGQNLCRSTAVCAECGRGVDG